MPLTPGDLILHDKYRIERLIGEGAFGTVYCATHVGLQVQRALKILRTSDPGVSSTHVTDTYQRFQLEAQLGARLDHPNVIRVYDFEHTGEVLALVMEYAAGGSLADRLAAQQSALMPVDEAVRIALDVAQGLAAIHALDAVHRDLKPSNILFDQQGRAKVADLGLAQVAGGPSQRSLCEGVPHPGTPSYMSPEQEHTFAYLTPASDVFALGVVLFEMLTGRSYKLQRPGTRLRKVRPDAPEWMDDLIAHMLADDARQRLWDGTEVAQALRQRAFTGLEAKATPKLKNRGDAVAARTAEEETTILNKVMKVPIPEMVKIPAGKFIMGGGINRGDQPRHRVYLDTYDIGRYPVTNEEYAAFVQATRRAAPSGWQGECPPQGKDRHPVVGVPWADAVAYCDWLKEQTGEAWRLPTEAEWEMAARGKDGRTWPWGDFMDSGKANTWEGGKKDTTPVGAYSLRGDSPYGCADMAGNVSEWVGDWEDEEYYRQSPANNPTGPSSGQYRVIRGGSWQEGQEIARAYFGIGMEPAFISDHVGFRCARGSAPH